MCVRVFLLVLSIMSRATNAPVTHARRKRVLRRARGYFGNKSRLFRYAKEATFRAGAFAYRDRRKKKTTFRQLWMVRLNAACRANKISYSRFIHALKVANVELNRKSLSELAIKDPPAFSKLVASLIPPSSAP